MIGLPLNALCLQIEYFCLVTQNGLSIVPPGYHISVLIINALPIDMSVTCLFQETLLKALGLWSSGSWIAYFWTALAHNKRSTGKTNSSSARRKEDKVPVLVNACEEARDQTWTYPSKALRPIHFLFTLLAADPVVTWPQSTHIVLRNSWEMADFSWEAFIWKLRAAPCFWCHLGFYLCYHTQQARTKSLALRSNDTFLNYPPPVQDTFTHVSLVYDTS